MLESKKFHIYEIAIDAFKTSTTMRGEEGAVAKIHAGIKEKVSDNYGLIITEKDGLNGYLLKKQADDAKYMQVYVQDFELYILPNWWSEHSSSLP